MRYNKSMPFREAIEPVVTDPQTETENPGYETSRNASLITLARIEDYKELWAETGQKGDDLFLQKTRQIEGSVFSDTLGKSRD